MDTVRSKDGTTIAFDKPQLAELLAQHFTVHSYDRRGRGESGDSKPYAIERVIEVLVDFFTGS